MRKSGTWFDKLGRMKNGIKLGLTASLLACALNNANADGVLDPKPMAYQSSYKAVDGFNFNFGVIGGSLDGVSNGMAMTSVSLPIPYFSNFGIQGDLAYGLYDGVNADTSAAAALHIFWRNPGVGMLGIYGDWAYLNPVHAGRLGMEGAIYNGNWTLDGFAGMEFGQNVYTKFVEEVDLSYYFDENTKMSIGHRFMARGNVANLGFEKQFAGGPGSAWSLFGEAEIGEDSYFQAFLGLRASFGGNAPSLMARDRQSMVHNRIPRNLAAITQCATVDTPFPAPSWLTNVGLINKGSYTEDLCASKRSLNRVSSTGIYNP